MMRKDIFIDNNAALHFTNPPSEAYKELIEWLKDFNNCENDAYLVLSQQILKEYTASLGGSKRENNMIFIIALIEDLNFLNDTINFPGFHVRATTSPETLNYK